MWILLGGTSGGTQVETSLPDRLRCPSRVTAASTEDQWNASMIFHATLIFWCGPLATSPGRRLKTPLPDRLRSPTNDTVLGDLRTLPVTSGASSGGNLIDGTRSSGGNSRTRRARRQVGRRD